MPKAKAALLVHPPPFDFRAEQLAAEVDELGALERELTPLKPKLARADVLRKSIRSRFDADAAAASFEARGEKFIISVGPRAVERTIDLDKLWKLAGVATFRRIATVTLARLEAAGLAPGVIPQVVTSDYTGSRTLKVLERGV